jgi:hypothetical protein
MLTDVSGLNHADIVSTVPNAANTFLSVLSDESSHVRFLGWRTTTSNYCRQFRGNFYKLVSEGIEAELRNTNSKSFCLHSKRKCSSPGGTLHQSQDSSPVYFARILAVLEQHQPFSLYIGETCLVSRTCLQSLTLSNLVNVLVSCDQLRRDGNTRSGFNLVTSKHPNLDTRIPE